MLPIPKPYPLLSLDHCHDHRHDHRQASDKGNYSNDRHRRSLQSPGKRRGGGEIRVRVKVRIRVRVRLNA